MTLLDSIKMHELGIFDKETLSKFSHKIERNRSQIILVQENDRQNTSLLK